MRDSKSYEETLQLFHQRVADPARNKSLERFAVLGKKYRNTVDDGAVGGSETQPRPERKRNEGKKKREEIQTTLG